MTLPYARSRLHLPFSMCACMYVTTVNETANSGDAYYPLIVESFRCAVTSVPEKTAYVLFAKADVSTKRLQLF